MALSAALQKAMHTWASVMMIALFATDIAPYRFSKKGDASASWDWEVSAEKPHPKQEARSWGLPSDPKQFVSGFAASKMAKVSQLRQLGVQDGLAEAAMINEPVDLEVEYGLRELLSELGQVRKPGTPSQGDATGAAPNQQQPGSPRTPPAPKQPSPPQYEVTEIDLNVPGQPRREPFQYRERVPSTPPAPEAPRTPDAPDAPEVRPPVVPVEAPVPPKSDASIILIDQSTRMAVEGLISELTMDVGRATRGFAFPMPKKPCSESTPESGLEFPDGELRIPDDAASFVIPEPGVQTVDLSHALLLSTDQPLVIVMEHVESGRSQFSSRASSAMPQTCPLRVVQDSSTNDLIQRSVIPAKGNGESEDIKAQIFGGKFDEESGAYKILTHRFSQPHTLVMHFLVKLGQIDPLALLHSTKSMLSTEEGYKLILPLSDKLGAQVDAEQVSNKVNSVERPPMVAQVPKYKSSVGKRRFGALF